LNSSCAFVRSQIFSFNTLAPHIIEALRFTGWSHSRHSGRDVPGGLPAIRKFVEPGRNFRIADQPPSD
jgi:hypothetical protein